LPLALTKRRGRGFSRHAQFNSAEGSTTATLDDNDKVAHSELVAEIKSEPDYDAALKALG